MATSQSQSFKGGNVSPGHAVYPEDLKKLVVSRTTPSLTPESLYYDPLVGETFELGRISFLYGGSVLTSYDAFDVDKQLDLSFLLETDGDGKDVTVTFSEASTRANINSQETLATMLGKIKKYFTDLKTVAFSGDYTDLINKPSIPAAQVQSDWTQNDNTKPDFIKNKPSIPAAQVQSDWNQSNNTQPDFIKNKPSIPTIPGVFSTSQNGLVPAASGTGDTGKFLKGDGSWSDVPAPSVFNTTNDGLVPKASGIDDTSKYLKGDGTWDSPPTLPAATQDSVWSHLDGGDLWAPVTFGNYEIPYSLSPDIPDAYKNLYQQVEYIWSNDGGLINVNGLNFKSSDKFIVNLYIKDIRNDQNWLVAGSQSANLTGSLGFEFAMSSAYYTGNCMYKVKFGSSDRQGSVLYKSGTTNPDKPELVRRQQVICKCPYLYANGDAVISNGVLNSKNMTCIRYVGTDSGLARWYAFGIMEVRDDDDNIIVKLVPCLNKSTGKYGVFCVQTSQFCGAWSGTIQEFIAP